MIATIIILSTIFVGWPGFWLIFAKVTGVLDSHRSFEAVMWATLPYWPFFIIIDRIFKRKNQPKWRIFFDFKNDRMDLGTFMGTEEEAMEEARMIVAQMTLSLGAPIVGNISIEPVADEENPNG